MPAGKAFATVKITLFSNEQTSPETLHLICRDYIGRVNLYRQRVWTCKATGKTNLTYEEALLSEQRANEKIQQFPKAYVKPVLEMIQFSKPHVPRFT